MMKKLLTLFGTRPEAIKLAPVLRQLQALENDLELVVAATGQHDSLLKQATASFGIEPQFNLQVMRNGQSLTGLTVRLLQAVDELLISVKPDLLLVQGDTTSVMAGALAAFYRQIPVAHLEAGLRSDDTRHPYPEEVNRRITDQVADLYFAPTELNRAALLRGGVPAERIHVTGNTVVDALLGILENMNGQDAGVPGINGAPYVVVTVHRRENFGEPIRRIFSSLRILAARYPGYRFVYPVHPNPEVSEQAREHLGGIANIQLIEPLDYQCFIRLLAGAQFILSDSGGVQEEAPTLNKPLLILREKTERQEIVEAGGALLVGADGYKIVEEASRLIEDESHYNRMADVKNPFGNGTAARKVVKIIKDYLLDG